MKITIKEPAVGAEEEIIILCHNISPELYNALKTIKARGNFLIANSGNETHRVNPSDIFYIESVDNKTFLYCESSVYESKQKLYELEELAMSDFLRVSKSVIVNLTKIKALAPALSGRLEAILQNGERIIISRLYVGNLKENLGM